MTYRPCVSSHPTNRDVAPATFGARDDGAVAIIFALSITLLAAIAGGAVDYGRWHSTRAHAQSTIDAAVLAAGRAMQLSQLSESEVVAIAQNYYANNRRDPLTGERATFSIEDGRIVSGRLEAGVPTAFLGVIGIHDLRLDLTSKALTASGAGAGGNLEMALMLDVTGSMCNDGQGPCATATKLDALKAAASELVNIVVWADQSRYTSKVALVPFATRVRVGPDNGGTGIMRDLTNLPATWSGWMRICVDGTGAAGSEGNGGPGTCNRYEVQRVSDWRLMPCVTDRTGPHAFTDEVPGSGRWLNGHDGSRRQLSEDSSDTPLTVKTGTSLHDPAEQWNYSPMEWGGGVCADVAQANEVMPLTSDKSALLSRINGLEAFGATGGALGTAWTWYMLSPRWRDVWRSESRPGSYSDLTAIGENGAPRLRKIAVLMSDGEFNTWRGWKEQDQQMVSDNARQICANMKSAGIEVYAVGFALDELPPARRTIAAATLRDCATSASHFYDAASTQQLQFAFRDIGLQATKLRLTN